MSVEFATTVSIRVASQDVHVVGFLDSDPDSIYCHTCGTSADITVGAAPDDIGDLEIAIDVDTLESIVSDLPPALRRRLADGFDVPADRSN